MADMILTAAIAAAVFFIIRGRLRKLRSGSCGCGCGGCSGCAGGSNKEGKQRKG
nr:FeoB-associated Cys-rich membrane protein [uncultured Acetatifactor sp.]